MSRLEELPPDQRAALALLVRQRKSYAEVAEMLHIPARAVHDRAHAALAVLAPREARGVDPERRLEVGDYLLGQQGSISERLKTRTYLGSSEGARNWAEAVAAQLAPLSDGQALPDIPHAAPTAAPQAPQAPPTQPPPPAAAPPAAAAAEPPGPAQRTPPSTPSSRLGGALVLAAVVVAIVVAVLLITSGGGGKSSSHPKTTASSKSSTGTTGPAVHQIVLSSPNPRSRSAGVVEVLSEGGKKAFYIEADDIPETKGFFYAVWLYNNAHSLQPLSKAPPVGKSKRLAGGALLPPNAGEFKKILLTRDTNHRPLRPGRVVLSAPFSL